MMIMTGARPAAAAPLGPLIGRLTRPRTRAAEPGVTVMVIFKFMF
jgi:hypothetical protein